MRFIAMAVLTGFLVGCADGKGDLDNKAASMLDDFIIVAYSGPPVGEVNLKRYREIADAGIGYLVPANGAFDAAGNIKAMELGAQVGVKILPVDLRLFPFELKPEMEVDPATVDAIATSYKDRPAMGAYVVKDEPNSDLFPVLRKICDLFRAADPAHPPLINLFPSYGSPVQLGFADYRAYVSSYIKTVKPELLAYDYYALRNETTMYDGWFSDLSIVREETRKAEIPFLVFVQSEGIRESLRVPNRAEILWQVNTALAYGAQGFGWFSYWTPVPDQGFQQAEGAHPPIVESHYNAMIDIDGSRTEVYDHVREANLYIKKAGDSLLGWDNRDVARFGGGKLLDGHSPLATPEGAEANVVVGTFRKEDSVRLVIANSSCEKETRFLLKLRKGWKLSDVFSSIDATPAGEGLLEWTLAPGGSVLLDPALSVDGSSCCSGNFTVR